MGGRFLLNTCYFEWYKFMFASYAVVLLLAIREVSAATDVIKIHSILLESDDALKGYLHGSPVVIGDSAVQLRLIGQYLHNSSIISFTHTDCVSQKVQVLLQTASPDGSTAIISANFPVSSNRYYICTSNGSKEAFDPVPKVPWLGLYAHEKYYLPIWLQVIIISLLLFLSATFSGLNLGLMSLDIVELKVLCTAGSSEEQSYAKKIEPLRRRGNFLLCVLVLGNVLVNTTLTILLDNIIGSGWQVIVCSTLAIVIIGEIAPQAICSRHGLAIGARTVFITYIFMFLTAPLAFPLSKLLDLLLGEEMGQVFNRDRLREMIKLNENTDLQRDEVDIITGVLGMTKKTAKDVMTLKQDVFMLDYNKAVLNFSTIADIKKTGYTRIPVYEYDTDHIVAILNVKDLALLDPDDNLPLGTVVKNFRYHFREVDETILLPDLLQLFRRERFHLAPVVRHMRSAERDPYTIVVGIVTLEDVLEEIIGAEINDETDVISDNREKRRLRKGHTQDYRIFENPADQAQHSRISEQLALAAFHYLSTMVEPFKGEYLTPGVLKRLLNDSLTTIKLREDMLATECLLYQCSKPTDYFVLLLEGRVRVEAGKEKLVFEAGPFHSFGMSVLMAADNQQPLLPVVSSPSRTPLISNLQRTEMRNSLSGLDGVMMTAPSPASASPKAPPSHLHRIKTGSVSVLPPPPFIPDYTATAITDVVFVKVERTKYLLARKSSSLANATQDRPSDHSFHNSPTDPLCIDDTDLQRSNSELCFSKDLPSPAGIQARRQLASESSFSQEASHSNSRDNVNRKSNTLVVDMRVGSKQLGVPRTTSDSTQQLDVKVDADMSVDDERSTLLNKNAAFS